MKKKGFTILELIMVIGIILILILTFRNIFENTNKDFLYAETCINKVYGDMNNFIFSAITNKGLYVSGNIIHPKQYNITLESGNIIKLGYIDQNNQSGTYLLNDLSSPELELTYCKNINYQINFTNDNFYININKDIIYDSSLGSFTIQDGEKTFVKDINFSLCYTGNNCKEIAKFIIDARTQSLQKKFCIQINQKESECLQRDK